MSLDNTAVVPLIAGGAYDTTVANQSLRFNDDDSAYLSRTPSSEGNRKLWTWSAWVKRSAVNLGSNAGPTIFSAGQDASNRLTIRFLSDTSDCLDVIWNNAGSVVAYKRTDAEFRDPSAWYHIVVVLDTDNSTADDRLRLYINGERVTSFRGETNPSQGDSTCGVNSTNAHYIGRDHESSYRYFDGYLTDIYFVDGEALGPEYFGETDATYGHWKPKADSTLTLGTNGFHLDFSNASSLGEDQSDNGNDWTANNLAATDVVIDCVSNNFATFNPLFSNVSGSAATLSEGNLGASVNPIAVSTFNIPTSGKWYAEFYCESRTAASSTYAVGIHESYLGAGSDYNVLLQDGYGYYGQGRKYPFDLNAAQWSSYGATFDTGDIIGVLVDTTNNNLTFYKNGTSQGQLSYSARPDTVELMFGVTSGSGDGENTYIANFGQDSSFAGTKTAQNNTDANSVGDFYYTVPTGALALCTSNLSTPAVVPSENFNATTYTGNGSTGQSITGVGFQPDFIWFKSRSTTPYHVVFDSVRGRAYGSSTNTTSAEFTSASTSNDLVSFDTDGFTVGNPAGWGSTNASSASIVAWSWKASGSTTSNTDGDVTSTVSVNSDAGFSIVKYSTANDSNYTAGHGLSQKPEFILNFARDVSSWRVVYHGFWGVGYRNRFATTGYFEYYAGTNYPTVNSTEFSIGTGLFNSGTEEYMAYCFHSVEGFSKIGAYLGNGSTNGPFVYTGFSPAFVLIKQANASGESWSLHDNARDTDGNPNTPLLFPNNSNAESDGVNTHIDFLSNGFKPRVTATNYNQSGYNYSYIAFAETPFKYANAK